MKLSERFDAAIKNKLAGGCFIWTKEALFEFRERLIELEKRLELHESIAQAVESVEAVNSELRSEIETLKSQMRHIGE